MPNSKTGKRSTSKSAPARRSPIQGMVSKKPSRPSSSARNQGKARSSQTLLLPVGLTPERKIDLLGVVILLVGLLTLVSLFPGNTAGFAISWISALKSAFGWGTYLLPLALIVLGGWLIARRIEKLPVLSIERITGLVLLFLVLLVIFQGISGKEGLGGGFLGSLMLSGLVRLLGGAGTFILALAWLLISLIMSLDVSVQKLFSWTQPLGNRLQDRLKRTSKTARDQPNLFPLPSSQNRPDDFIPLDRPMTNQPGEPTPPPAQSPGNPSAMPWTLPRVQEVLEPGVTPQVNEEFIQKRARMIEETLASFGAPGQVVEISRGPAITQFGVEPLFIESRAGRTRVRVAKIVALADDLALALAAPRIRIQAPVPGRSFVGIEVPNEEMSLVMLREVVESEAFKRLRSNLRFALGKGVAGHPLVADLVSMPHLLIAGTTGSGKSVCVNSILTCLLLNNTPDDLRLVLIDPKRVELTSYNGVPHLLSPVVVEMDRVVGALQWMTREMDNRYHKFSEVGARNIADYNTRMVSKGSPRLPFIVVLIDELADLMMIAPDETERTITRLAQLARATGIHLVIATQRPSVDVVTGLIKANFPARIAFMVASGMDSRVILDHPGAERLLGRGDMLFQAPDAPAPLRVQGVYVSDAEIQRLTQYWRSLAGAASPMMAAASGIVDAPAASGVPLRQVPMFEDMSPVEKGDPMLDEAIDIVRREGRASVSMLQRRLRIGYTRAARLVDSMEEKGIVSSPQGGGQTREVLDYGATIPPADDGM